MGDEGSETSPSATNMLAGRRLLGSGSRMDGRSFSSSTISGAKPGTSISSTSLSDMGSGMREGELLSRTCPRDWFPSLAAEMAKPMLFFRLRITPGDSVGSGDMGLDPGSRGNLMFRRH